MGSSAKLSIQAGKKIAAILDANKAIEFEIIGHVCCTLVITLDAVDRKETAICKSRQICFPLSNE
jgi:hypothetical protein